MQTQTDRPWQSCCLGPDLVLGVFNGLVLGCAVVGAAGVVVVMVPRGKRRGCKHHQKQCKSKKLFHGLNVARSQQKR
jgi:hypothetical protein